MSPLANLQQETLLATLGIEITEATKERVIATMPVGPKVHQPFGLLHGGASVVLAETLGSVGANCCVDPDRYYCVGQEINANHLRAVRSGRVTGTARPIHIGGRSQVWEIRVEDERQRLTAISRMTLAVVAGQAPALGGDGRS